MTRKKLDYKWVVLLLVSIAYFLAQGTRLIYSAVLPQIKTDFAANGVTDAQLGLISSAFTLVFGIAIPFAGLIADFFNRKRVLVLGSFMFAVGIFVSGFATGVYDSNIYAALFDVINPRFRAVATGLFGCGGCIVGAFGPAVMGFLNDAFTPRVSMASLAAIAVVGALVILCARVFTFKKDKIRLNSL